MDYKRLKHLRKNILKLSQANFATSIGVDQTLVSKMEKNERTITLAIKEAVIKEHGINPDWWESGKEPIFFKTLSEEAKDSLIDKLRRGYQKYKDWYDKKLEEVTAERKRLAEENRKLREELMKKTKESDEYKNKYIKSLEKHIKE